MRDLEYEELARACNRSYLAVKEELEALSVPELLCFTAEEATLLASFNVSVPVGRFVCSQHLPRIRAAHLRRVRTLLLSSSCCCAPAPAAALLLLVVLLVLLVYWWCCGGGGLLVVVG